MRLQVGALHIWRADLDAVGIEVEQLLGDQEQARAARIMREPARRRWMAARGVLRILLSEYLDEDPPALRFTQEPQGKPLLDLPGERPLHFNLSHSGRLAVYALSEMCPVGVDLELVSRHPGGRTHRQDFLRAWVRHEAEVKRLGARGKNAPERASASGKQPWTTELKLGPEAVGAVALETPPVDFRVYPVDFRSYGSILPAGTITPIGNESNVSK